MHQTGVDRCRLGDPDEHDGPAPQPRREPGQGVAQARSPATPDHDAGHGCAGRDSGWVRGSNESSETSPGKGVGCDSGRVADDVDIQQHIKGLIDEEHGLRSRLGKGEITIEEENQRLRTIEVELDQCWDLLRQRRARREFGEDPAGAEVRDAGTVENYRG